MKTTTLWRALARVAVLAGGLATLSPAVAQDAAIGEQLYKKTFVTGVRTCLVCHFGTPKEDTVGVMVKGADANRIRGAAMSQAQMKPLYGVVTDEEYNHMAAYIAKEFGINPTFISVSAAPSPTVSATSLTFASQKVATTSAAQAVTVTNASGATAALALSAFGTTTGSDFSVSSSTCTLGAGIAAGGSCTINVVFKPTATGARTSTLTLAHNGPGGKTEVALSGQAIENTSPIATVSPASLAFSTLINTDSTAMRATLSNTGNATLAISSLAITGTNAGDYRLAASTTCAANGSVTGGSSCVVDVIFKPTAAGARSASVAIAHNATGGSTAIALNGTGKATAEPMIALDATEVDLGAQPIATTSAPKTVTLTNAGDAALNLSSLAVSGTDFGDFILGGTCTGGSTVAVRGTCTITVAMKPDVQGAKTATLTIASNATGGAVTLPLRGTAVRTPAPQVGLSQSSVGFGIVSVGTTSVARTVTLTNTGTASMKVIKIESTNQTDFTTTKDCGDTLAVGASCQISVSYTPPGATVSTEAVVVTTDALSSPNTIVLTGEGTTQALSVLAWQGTATSLNFASTVVGETSASQTLTLVNKGPGAVSITTLGTAGASPTSFAIAGTSTCTLGLSLAANATCTVIVNFVPATAGAHAANLQVASTGTVPGDIALTGTGAAKTNPVGALSGDVGTLDFSGTVLVPGATSAPRVLTVKNTGTADAAITGLTITGPFSIQTGGSGACPVGASTLAIGATCKVSVVYSPTTAGMSTGTLTVGSATTPLSISLKGQSQLASAGVLTANPTQLEFPSTALNQTSAAKTVTIANGNTAAVTITNTAVNGPFSISATTCGTSLAINTNCTLSLVFAPKSATATSGTLTVTTGTNQMLEVSLTGATPADPGNPGTGTSAKLARAHDSLGFTGALGAVSRTEKTSFTNAGTGDLVIREVNTSSSFEVVPSASNGCKPAQTLAAGKSCEVAVVFRSPVSTGNVTGTLTVTAAAAGSSTVETSTVALNAVSVVTNAGGSKSDDDEGGGATDPITLLLLGALAAFLFTARQRRGAR